MPCNHNLYIGIIIFFHHLDSTQSTCYNLWQNWFISNLKTDDLSNQYGKINHPPKLQSHQYKYISNTIIQVLIYGIMLINFTWMLGIHRSLNYAGWLWHHWPIVTSPKSSHMPSLGLVDLRHLMLGYRSKRILAVHEKNSSSNTI